MNPFIIQLFNTNTTLESTLYSILVTVTVSVAVTFTVPAESTTPIVIEKFR